MCFLFSSAFPCSSLPFCLFVLLLLSFFFASSAWALFLASLQQQCLCDGYHVRGLACSFCSVVVFSFAYCFSFNGSASSAPLRPWYPPQARSPCHFKKLSVLKGGQLSLLSHLCRTFYSRRCLLCTGVLICSYRLPQGTTSGRVNFNK